MEDTCGIGLCVSRVEQKQENSAALVENIGVIFRNKQ